MYALEMLGLLFIILITGNYLVMLAYLKAFLKLLVKRQQQGSLDSSFYEALSEAKNQVALASGVYSCLTLVSVFPIFMMIYFTYTGSNYRRWIFYYFTFVFCAILIVLGAEARSVVQKMQKLAALSQKTLT